MKNEDYSLLLDSEGHLVDSADVVDEVDGTGLDIVDEEFWGYKGRERLPFSPGTMKTGSSNFLDHWTVPGE